MMTVIIMTTMLINAIVEAFANCATLATRSLSEAELKGTFAISRYKESGYETPMMKIIMTACLFVRSQRKGT